LIGGITMGLVGVIRIYGGITMGIFGVTRI
jgi:hypothetical protein